MAAVKLEGVEKHYGAVHVVRGLSLTIEEGEFVSLLGPSGCGKTTTLRMVAGLERPDGGTISIHGTTVDGGGAFVAPEKRSLGMVFQSYAVWPHRSVAQNVAYPLELQRVPKAEIAARVKEALTWVRLPHLAERMPGALSGGQLQRVAIARALVAKPKVLLLDEPLSNLDAALREELRGELAQLRRRVGTTMIYVTHDQAEALALSDRVAVMNQGVIEQLAAPQALYREPATPFVAAFVGAANVLEGEADGVTFRSDGQSLELDAPAAPAKAQGSLVVRLEDIALGEGPNSLPLEARLFMGSQTEYRMTWGATTLRAVGPFVPSAEPGQPVRFRVTQARFFPKP